SDQSPKEAAREDCADAKQVDVVSDLAPGTGHALGSSGVHPAQLTLVPAPAKPVKMHFAIYKQFIKGIIAFAKKTLGNPRLPRLNDDTASYNGFARAVEDFGMEHVREVTEHLWRRLHVGRY